MKTVTLKIDGKSITADEGTTLFQAAKKAGIEIPNLCHDDRLEPYGACRLCMVEITTKNGRTRLVASCCYPAEDGLVVKTKTPKVDNVRKILAELLLSVSPSGAHVELAKQYGITESRFKQTENPETPCTLCGRCVRYAAEVKKCNAICFVGRGIDRTIAMVPGLSDKCVSCRECLDVCDAGKMAYMVDMIQEISCPPLEPRNKRRR